MKTLTKFTSMVYKSPYASMRNINIFTDISNRNLYNISDEEGGLIV